ncbi:RNA 2',3'-cyclic phosphodiesterase [Actinoplanes sp. NPDC051633]|uniref:RNA 2',3'-cyclic phosphodiesterase n=1 Tax=Actinoplanes sp. NPDC051633 TaxID=3155670 RepID=UPI0034364303
MRLFVALYPPEDVRSALRQWLSEALARDRAEVRLGDIERWHLTLAFLGEVVAEEVPRVELAVSRAVLDRPAMRLRLSGGGSFGRGRSSAVWAGVDGDLEALRDLHADLRDRLAEARFTTDARPLTPHLTVTYKGGREVLAALRDYAGPVWSATEITLVRSRFPQESGYDTLRVWSLHQDGDTDRR